MVPVTGGMDGSSTCLSARWASTAVWQRSSAIRHVTALGVGGRPYIAREIVLGAFAHNAACNVPSCGPCPHGGAGFGPAMALHWPGQYTPAVSAG